jgi:FtsH-binding integral membrane protein
MSQSFTKFYLYSGVIAFIIILYLISTSSFKNGKPTCNNYVFNVYLYLAMSITLLGLFAYVINELVSKDEKEKHELMPMNYVHQKLGWYSIFGIILSFVFIIMMALTPSFSKEGHVYNHIIWVLFVASISVMIYPYFKSEELADVVDDSLVSTALVFIFMSIIVYSQPSFFSGTYNYVMPGLIVGLFAIIIVSLFNIFFTKDMEMYRKSSIYISYIVILLFSLFVSYDTSKMFEMAKICVNYPNYPKNSVDFFLDLLNLFVSFVNVYSN